MWLLALNLGEILREFGEILRKYRILDESSVGSKGLTKFKFFACKSSLCKNTSSVHSLAA